MRLQVKNVLGQSVTVDAEHQDTITAVKVSAGALFGLGPDFRHKLFFQGKVIKDSTRVGSLSIPPGHFFTLLTFQAKKTAEPTLFRTSASQQQELEPKPSPEFRVHPSAHGEESGPKAALEEELKTSSSLGTGEPAFGACSRERARGGESGAGTGETAGRGLSSNASREDRKVPGKGKPVLSIGLRQDQVCDRSGAQESGFDESPRCAETQGEAPHGGTCQLGRDGNLPEEAEGGGGSAVPGGPTEGVVAPTAEMGEGKGRAEGHGEADGGVAGKGRQRKGRKEKVQQAREAGEGGGRMHEGSNEKGENGRRRGSGKKKGDALVQGQGEAGNSGVGSGACYQDQGEPKTECGNGRRKIGKAGGRKRKLDEGPPEEDEEAGHWAVEGSSGNGLGKEARRQNPARKKRAGNLASVEMSNKGAGLDSDAVGAEGHGSEEGGESDDREGEASSEMDWAAETGAGQKGRNRQKGVRKAQGNGAGRKRRTVAGDPSMHGSENGNDWVKGATTGSSGPGSKGAPGSANGKEVVESVGGQKAHGRTPAGRTSKAPSRTPNKKTKPGPAVHADKDEKSNLPTEAENDGENGDGADPRTEALKEKGGRRPPKGALDGKKQEGRGGNKKAEAAMSMLPLPPCLQMLEQKFGCLNAFYSFLLKQHIQATWHTTREGVGGMLQDIGGWTPEDVENMAMLCPKVVSIRDRVASISGAEGQPNFTIDLWDPTRPASEQLATSGLMMPSAPLGEEGYDIIPGGPKKPSQRAILRAEERRSAAFGLGLAARVARVHADFLHQHHDPALREFDPMKEGSWHPDFPLAELSLSTLLAEARATAMADDRSGLLAGLGGPPGSPVGAGDSPAGHEEKGAPPRPPRQLKKVPRCSDTTHFSAHEMVAHLRSSLGSLGQMLHCEHLKKREAAYGRLSQDLSPATWEALHRKGIRRLYVHQTRAINHAMAGRSVVVATATASGKSLCYNIPVVEALQGSPEASALYLFPTKALAQDQRRALGELLEGMPHSPTVAVYDGDTCQSDRPEIRNTAQLIITNPDMLHVSILPCHNSFARILANLRYVVVDEAHAYRGALGCHTALILRRLRRICCQVYGSSPTFIICSATVANPREHAQELTGLQEVEAVLEDGSPCGEKLFALWNPPVVHVPAKDKKWEKVRSRQKINFACGRSVQTKRGSPIVEVALLLAEMVQHGLRCIAFCGTRKLCELVFTYTRETLKETAPQLLHTIRAYRSGYMAKERREIERELFAGELRGVAATNALELGVDVGSLDATLHLGFQGTVASMWQQAGRAGRREKPSLSVYVAFESPLDQYFMKAPQRLFSRPIEHAQVDSQNPEVLAQHLACAAFEHALRPQEDEEHFGAGVGAATRELVEKGILGRHPTNGHADKSWHYIGHAKSPSQEIGIRAIDPEKYTIIDERNNEVIEEVEESKAFFVVYEGAVYLQQGRTYLVKALNLAKREARCAQADLKYYTKTVDMTDVFVLGGSLAYHGRLPPDAYPSTTAQCSPCRVTTRWMGFRRIWQGSNETFDYVQLFLPEVTFRSQAAWIRVPRGIRGQVEARQLEFRASLHAASHALVNVMPLYVMCSSADVGAECAHPNDTRYHPERILVYDRHPGGIGLAVQARPMFAELLRAALELVAACDCPADGGCPSCVQTLKCSEYNEVLDKKGAVIILQGIIDAEDAYREGRADPPPFEELLVEPEEGGPRRQWSRPLGGFCPPRGGAA